MRHLRGEILFIVFVGVLGGALGTFGLVSCEKAQRRETAAEFPKKTREFKLPRPVER